MSEGAASIEALRREPQRADLHLAHAARLEAAGQVAAAVAHYQRAVVLAPRDSTIHDRLVAAMPRDLSPERLASDYAVDRLGANDGMLKAVVVISHERSGTHLLINTLAFNFGYLSLWIDAVPDLSAGWPDFAPFLADVARRRLTNVVKSHHARALFPPSMGDLAEAIHFLYIVRDGRDVMTSFWNFARRAALDEGPKVADAGAFMRARPRGRPLAYDPEPHATMLDRWVAHLEGWLPAVESGAVTLVRYEDLLGDLDRVLDRLGEAIGRALRFRVRPTLRFPSVAPWKGKQGNWRDYLTDADRAWFERTVGALMRRLGYDGA